MKARSVVDPLLGLAAFAAVAGLVLVSVLAYNRVFVPSDTVMLQAGTLGNALQKGSDVKLNGVPVGRVRSVTPVPGGASLGLDLDPSVLADLSPDTTARLLPKTLFGERFVALIPPAAGAQGSLRAGDTIREDTSATAVELQQLFDQMLPLLRSIQPDKLAAMMGELATMLRGRGADIGSALTEWAAYLRKLNPHLPALTEDFARLASVARTYDVAAPDLVDALATMTTTARTLVDQQSQLRQVYATVIGSADTTRGWVAENQNTIVILSDRSRAALEAVRPYAAEFPCVFDAARRFIPRMDHVLGKGTGEPGMHVRLSVVAARGKYLPGRNAPHFSTGGGPRCPYVTGQVGAQPARAHPGEPQAIPAPPSALLRQPAGTAAGLGPANSPGENQLIGELLAPEAGIGPTDYPQWASLLVGPLLRGKGVILR
jgi:phospholipid/cholesterol/gamma-HCH transport system substrate-binding protein